MKGHETPKVNGGYYPNILIGSRVAVAGSLSCRRFSTASFLMVRPGVCWANRFSGRTWVFPKIGVFTPQIIHFLIGFSILNHPFWGKTRIFGNIHIFLEHWKSYFTRFFFDIFFLQVKEWSRLQNDCGNKGTQLQVLKYWVGNCYLY